MLLLSYSTAEAEKHTNCVESAQSCSTVLHPRPKTNTNSIKQGHIPVVEPTVNLSLLWRFPLTELLVLHCNTTLQRSDIKNWIWRASLTSEGRVTKPRPKRPFKKPGKKTLNTLRFCEKTAAATFLWQLHVLATLARDYHILSTCCIHLQCYKRHIFHVNKM